MRTIRMVLALATAAPAFGAQALTRGTDEMRAQVRENLAARAVLEQEEPTISLLDVSRGVSLAQFRPRSPRGVLAQAINSGEIPVARLGFNYDAKPYEARVDDHLIRGSEKSEAEFVDLANRVGGVDKLLVINLRYENNNEGAILRSHGIGTAFIPVFDQSLPSTGQVQAFLTIRAAAIAAGKTIYVHCEQGIGRTGVFAAIHEITSGAELPAVLAEATDRGMNAQVQIDFITRFYNDFKAGKSWTGAQASANGAI